MRDNDCGRPRAAQTSARRVCGRQSTRNSVQQGKKCQECADDEKLKFSSLFLLFRYFFVFFYLVNNFSLKIFAKLGLVGQFRAQLEILDCHAARLTVNWKPNCAAGVKHPKGKENVWTFFAVKKSSRQQKMWKIHIQLDEETTRERKIRESENVHFQHTVESSSTFPLQFLPPNRSAFAHLSRRIVTSRARRQINRHQQHRKTTTKPSTKEKKC